MSRFRLQRVSAHFLTGPVFWSFSSSDRAGSGGLCVCTCEANALSSSELRSVFSIRRSLCTLASLVIRGPPSSYSRPIYTFVGDVCGDQSVLTIGLQISCAGLGREAGRSFGSSSPRSRSLRSVAGGARNHAESNFLQGRLVTRTPEHRQADRYAR